MRKRLLSSSVKVFDRSLKRKQREWAVSIKDSGDYDYMRREIADRLVDKLDDIVRDFPRALDVGCHRGFVRDALMERNALVETGERPIGAIKQLTQLDSAGFKTFVEENKNGSSCAHIEASFQELDDEGTLYHLEPQSYDIVLSSLWMHWVNDIPDFLNSVRLALKPDGVFICSVFGGSTLEEFRHSFYLAELERKGGVSPHVSPLLRASDTAALMQQAKFSLPTVDVDNITVCYANAAVLMEHLVGMGEGAAAHNRQVNVGTESFLAMAAIYQELYGKDDGTIPVTYQVISMIGWNPHESQPKPLKRGSAAKSMREISGPVKIDKTNNSGS